MTERKTAKFLGEQFLILKIKIVWNVIVHVIDWTEYVSLTDMSLQQVLVFVRTSTSTCKKVLCYKNLLQVRRKFLHSGQI